MIGGGGGLLLSVSCAVVLLREERKDCVPHITITRGMRRHNFEGFFIKIINMYIPVHSGTTVTRVLVLFLKLGYTCVCTGTGVHRVL